MQNNEEKIIPILFEDTDLLAINKPANITVNKSDTTLHEITVQDWVEKKYPIREQEIIAPDGNNEYDPVVAFKNRAGIIHRLDKETSGVLLIAKTIESFIHMQAQFKERTVKKSYRALSHGKLVPKTGEIKAPVGRLPWNRKQFGIVAGGRESVTRYEVNTYYSLRDKPQEVFSYIHLFPETGRTHQIRVHLKYIGYPIVSDFLYGGRKTARDDRKLLGRVFLHAASISFVHPTSREVMHIESPLSEDLQLFIDTNLQRVE